jgi:pimeloyl-ACP methyl ester carboxylesterase
VHGSVVNAEVTWAAQQTLRERLEVVAPNRPGFPPGPPLERVGFDDELAWIDPRLEPGMHLVGHSYGGVVALLAAARWPDRVRSLVVVEPPAFAVAAGRPEIERYLAAATRLWEHGPDDPEAFLRAFLEWVGAPAPPGTLTPPLLQGARRLRVEQRPWTVEIPLGALAAGGFPILAVSGAHEPAFEAVCDVLATRTGAERAVLRGAGHSVQRLGKPFDELVLDFVERAERLDSGRARG